jgi:hypothetical protein
VSTQERKARCRKLLDHKIKKGLDKERKRAASKFVNCRSDGGTFKGCNLRKNINVLNRWNPSLSRLVHIFCCLLTGQSQACVCTHGSAIWAQRQNANFERDRHANLGGVCGQDLSCTREFYVSSMHQTTTHLWPPQYAVRSAKDVRISWRQCDNYLRNHHNRRR